MVTVIVGRKTEGSTCRVHTLAQGADEPTYTEFPSKGLSPGTPKWANYVKGVVDKFPGVYSVPTLYFVFVRCIQGRQCLILSMMAARKSAVTDGESPLASTRSLVPKLASVGWSAKRLVRLSRNVGKLCRICCARGSTFLSHVHSGLNQQDPVS